MQLHKFVASDVRSGLAQVRQKLGADAVVVTTRKLAVGVEIMAGSYADLESGASGLADSQMPGADQEKPKQETSAGSHAIWRELSRLRTLLQNQLAGLAWSAEKRRHPVRVHVMQQMLAAGFGAQLARHAAASLPGTYTVAQADAWLRLVMIRNLRTLDAVSMPDMAGGIWALVGPTGHGKTTSIAKLAARAALKHGAHRIALVSADNYRVGAQQQLEAYARLMRVDFVALEDVGQLAGVLAKLAGKFCVLIDSAGFAPQDKRFAEQVIAFKRSGVKCLLTVSASTQGNLAEQLIQGCQPEGVILTKLDEGGVFGAVLDCMMRHKIPLGALTSGQRVPEDLHHVHSAYLVDRALRVRGQGAFELREDDWPVRFGVDAEQEIPSSDSEANTQRIGR